MAELKIYGDITETKHSDEGVTRKDVDDFLSGLAADEPMDVYLSSYGGNVSVGMEIYNAIKRHKGHTRIHIDAWALSIASVIAFAGDELIVPDNAVMMVHLPYTLIIGNRMDMEREIKTLETVERSMVNVYKANLKQSQDADKIRGMLEDETWLDADEIADFFKVKRTSTNGSGASANGKVTVLAGLRKSQPAKNSILRKYGARNDMQKQHVKVAWRNATEADQKAIKSLLKC